MPRKADATSAHASNAAVALCAGMAIGEGADDAPEWVHLLPAGQITTLDGRGPYRIADASLLISTSLAAAVWPAPIDENHATDIAGPRGEPSPARGWITEMQARDDGVWGKVDWTPSGRALLADRAYRYISPVISHLRDGTVTAVLRASLVNRPNMRGLTSLNQETDMTDFLSRLRGALKLGDDAGEDAILGAIASASVATHAALSPIAKAVGLGDSASAAAVLAGVEGLKAGGGDQVKALQAELTELGGKFKALQDAGAKTAAEAFVDGAIKEGRVGVKALRDHYVSRHMADTASVEKEIAALPSLGLSGALVTPPAAADGSVALNADQAEAARLLGIPWKDYAAALKAEKETA